MKLLHFKNSKDLGPANTLISAYPFEGCAIVLYRKVASEVFGTAIVTVDSYATRMFLEHNFADIHVALDDYRERVKCEKGELADMESEGAK